MFEPKTDDEVVEIARRYGAPIVHVPCDTLRGREVATVDLRDRRYPVVTRARELITNRDDTLKSRQRSTSTPTQE